jgi:RNA polymerase sigma-32 factor
MTERKPPKRGKRKRSADVIDVDATRRADDEDAGDGEAKAEADDEEQEKEEGDGVDEEMAREASGTVIDVEPTGEEEAVDDSYLDRLEKEARKERVTLIKRDPMQAYMQEARRFPLLTPDEEKALAVRLFEHGDNAAARRMVEANLRLVVKIAYEYRRAHKNILDLVQEGNIGLIQAVGKFDPYRGVKLSSYAAFWIRAYILKFILNNWRLVKIGTTQAQRKLFFNLRKERERLEQLGFEPTTALIAENLQVTEKEVEEMDKRLSSPEASLDQPIGSDDDGARTRLDYLPSDDERPDRVVEQSEFSELLKSKLELFAQKLEGREQTIFRERWLTENPKTLQEIGDAYGVSRERARQLEKRLLGRLRKYLEAELGQTVDIDALSRD